MKSCLKIPAALAALTLAATTPLPAAETPAKKAEPVAVVNGTEIPAQSLDRRMAQLRPRFFKPDEQASEEKRTAFRTEVLDQLIAEELLFQQASEKGHSVPAGLVDEEMARFKGRFPDPQTFEQTLQRVGMTEAKLRRDMERSLVIQKMLREDVVAAIEIPDAEVKRYYDENPEAFKQPERVRASHILIKLEPGAEESSRKAAWDRIEKVRARLEAGEDFAALAREVSEGPSNTSGGDLGFFGRSQMVKPFEDAAFALEPGQTSGVVKTRFGYHLIRVTDRQAAGTAPYEGARDQIRERLTNERARGAVQEYIQKLTAAAEIKRTG